MIATEQPPSAPAGGVMPMIVVETPTLFQPYFPEDERGDAAGGMKGADANPEETKEDLGAEAAHGQGHDAPDADLDGSDTPGDAKEEPPLILAADPGGTVTVPTAPDERAETRSPSPRPVSPELVVLDTTMDVVASPAIREPAVVYASTQVPRGTLRCLPPVRCQVQGRVVVPLFLSCTHHLNHLQRQPRWKTIPPVPTR